MIYGANIFQIICEKEDAVDMQFHSLLGQSQKLATLFGISYLPSDCKIPIFILDSESFKQKKSLYFGESAGSEIIAFSTVQIYTAAYRAVCRQYSLENYHRVILHECVHILQRGTTMLPPKQAVWLYESAACYLAGQKEALQAGEKLPAWEEFQHNFYTVPGCYAIAYQLGKALLSNCGAGEAAARCADLPRCETICAKAYAKLFK